MPTIIKCPVPVCKYQFDDLCTRGEIEMIAGEHGPQCNTIVMPSLEMEINADPN